MVTSFVALFVLLAVGPALARGLTRLVRRVPILGALAALAVFFWLDTPVDAAETAPDPTAPWHQPTETTPAWSPEDPRAATTADEDMAGIYLEERARYAAEVTAAKERVQAWLGL